MPSGLREEMKSSRPKRRGTSNLSYFSSFLCFLEDHLTLGPLSEHLAQCTLHNAGWMAKDQVKLTAQEIPGLTSTCLFVSLVYSRFWNETAVADRAPFKNFKLLAPLPEYPERVIREDEVEAFSRHL